MAGFVNEEHRLTWQAAYRRHEAVIKSACAEWLAATKSTEDQARAELDAEHERHMAIVREINGRKFAALRPIEAPFKERAKALQAEKDRELKAITVSFMDQS